MLPIRCLHDGVQSCCGMPDQCTLQPCWVTTCLPQLKPPPRTTDNPSCPSFQETVHLHLAWSTKADAASCSRASGLLFSAPEPPVQRGCEATDWLTGPKHSSNWPPNRIQVSTKRQASASFHEAQHPGALDASKFKVQVAGKRLRHRLLGSGLEQIRN